MALSRTRGDASGEHRERHLWTHVLYADEHEEEVALGLGGEAEELDGVVAQDHVRV